MSEYTGKLATKAWAMDLIKKYVARSGGTSSTIVGTNSPASCLYITPRWLRFDPDNKKGLVIKAGTKIKNSAGNYKVFSEDTKYDFSSDISAVGTDYYVYMDDVGQLSITTDGASSQSGKVQIGRFHTLCANAGTSLKMTAPASPSSGLVANSSKYLIKSYDPDDDPDFYTFYNKTVKSITVQTYYDVVTVDHPLSGFVAGDILPESIFCLSFEPECLVDDAMVYDKDTGIAVDVYLQSGTGFNTRSKYNASHTVSRQPWNLQEDMRMVGKRLLYEEEFTSIALGSNEKTAIAGASDKTRVGGHSDTSGRRMISAIGVEEACGYLWQYLAQSGDNGGSKFETTDGHGSFGQSYGVPYVRKAGGGAGSSSCGSRARSSAAPLSGVGASDGARGSSRVRETAR